MKRIITEALRAYRQYGRRIHVPQVVKTIERPDYVRMSSLGLCPLKAAREKLGIIPDIPELTYEQDDSKAWLMDRGNYTAAQIQEALMFASLSGTKLSFLPEVELVDVGLKLAGRADGLIQWISTNVSDSTHTEEVTARGQAIIEIKDTEGIEKRSVGEPKLAYAYQLMGYLLASKINKGYIVTTSKWGWNIYELRCHSAKGHHDFYIVYDEYGNPYSQPDWMKSPNWNTPEFLNWDAWKQEVYRQHDYLIRVGKAYPQSIILPPNDPLNSDGAWQCAWHYKKATAKSDGEMKPACPWATSCHGLHARVYKTVKEGGQYKFKEPT